MGAEIRGPGELQREVGDTDLCTLCGACVGLCPYWATHRGRLVALDECNLSQGRCYAFCPRGPVDLDELNRTVFGEPRPDGELGTHREVVMTRARDAAARSGAQYGGTVSSLITFALEQGVIDSAVLTSTDREQLPGGTVVRDGAGVQSCAGSNFVAAPTLEAFNREAATGAARIGVVATPCQALALAKMRAAPLEDDGRAGKIRLVVGLFCTWALRYQDFSRFLGEKAPLGQITREDIPPPPAEVFEVYAGSSRVTIPLEEVRRFIRPACELCIDMTAELADLSVGAAEGVEGWNTLIVRSEAGAKLLAAAVAAGVVETAVLPPENLAHLREAALNKRRRALRNIVGKSGSDDELLYLAPSSEILKGLLE